MNASTALLGLAGIGQLASAISVFAVVWRWARSSERVDGTLKSLSDGQERIVRMLDALEIRVGRLEGRK